MIISGNQKQRPVTQFILKIDLAHLHDRLITFGDRRRTTAPAPGLTSSFVNVLIAWIKKGFIPSDPLAPNLRLDLKAA